MAGVVQDDWGFAEAVRKFERGSGTARGSRKPGRRWTAAPVRGAAHAGVWVGVIALLLMGLVGLRIGLMYKNMEFNQLIKQKNALSVENDQLSSDVSALSSPARIEQIAEGPLGMVPAGKVQYLYINPVDNQLYADLDPAAAGSGLNGRAASP